MSVLVRSGHVIVIGENDQCESISDILKETGDASAKVSKLTPKKRGDFTIVLWLIRIAERSDDNTLQSDCFGFSFEIGGIFQLQ